LWKFTGYADIPDVQVPAVQYMIPDRRRKEQLAAVVLDFVLAFDLTEAYPHSICSITCGSKAARIFSKSCG
jgi:hypothetical protein